MRARDIILWLALFITPGLGLALKSRDTSVEAFDRVSSVQRAEDVLLEHGLVRDDTSRVLISGISAAAIFHQPHCDGLLAVVPLPLTAQRFEHVVPTLGENVTASGYVFQGRHSDAYPALARLLASLLADLRIRDQTDTTVFSFKELGNCGLAARMDWSTLESRRT